MKKERKTAVLKAKRKRKTKQLSTQRRGNITARDERKRERERERFVKKIRSFSVKFVVNSLDAQIQKFYQRLMIKNIRTRV